MHFFGSAHLDITSVPLVSLEQISLRRRWMIVETDGVREEQRRERDLSHEIGHHHQPPAAAVAAAAKAQ